MPERKIRDVLNQVFNKFRPLRARPDKTHIPFEHIPELGNFIDSQSPDKITDPCYPRIILTRPYGTIGFSVGLHGTEFI